jgi:hypothetical protein
VDKDKLESILMRFDFSGQMGKPGGKMGKGEYVLL